MVTKTDSIKTLIFRAYDLCTEIKDSNEELEFLKDTFIANDFPINIVDRIFQKYIPHKYRTDGKENTQKTPIDFEKSFRVPYEKRFSDILIRELQKEGTVFTLFSAKGQLLKRNFANLHQRSQSRNQSTIFTGNTAPNVVQHTLGNPV